VFQSFFFATEVLTADKSYLLVSVAGARLKSSSVPMFFAIPIILKFNSSNKP
jgi:hypothetical protein